jgi:hypothetical protein
VESINSSNLSNYNIGDHYNYIATERGRVSGGTIYSKQPKDLANPGGPGVFTIGPYSVTFIKKPGEDEDSYEPEEEVKEEEDAEWGTQNQTHLEPEPIPQGPIMLSGPSGHGHKHPPRPKQLMQRDTLEPGGSNDGYSTDSSPEESNGDSASSSSDDSSQIIGNAPHIPPLSSPSQTHSTSFQWHTRDMQNRAIEFKSDPYPRPKEDEYLQFLSAYYGGEFVSFDEVQGWPQHRDEYTEADIWVDPRVLDGTWEDIFDSVSAGDKRIDYGAEPI